MSLPTEVFDNTEDTRNYVNAHIIENNTRSITEEHMSNILNSVLDILDQKDLKIGVTPIEDGVEGALLYVDASGKLKSDTSKLFLDGNVLKVNGKSAIVQDGNALGAAMSIGTNDSNFLHFRINSTNIWGISANGSIFNSESSNYLSIYRGSSTTSGKVFRNTNNSYSVFAFDNSSSSSTGHIVDFQNQGNTRSFVGNDGSLTFDNTASVGGITLYNTTDQTTNYERVKQYWGSNTFNIEIGNGGTGTRRSMVISAGDITLGGRFVSTGNGFSTGIATPNPGVSATALSSFTRSTASSNNYSSIGSFLTVNQSSTAGYRAIVASVYEQALGTGPHLLIDLGLSSSEGGAFTSKFSVDNAGNVVAAGSFTLPASTASLVPIKFTVGVDVTSPSNGYMWYNGTNLYFQNDDTSIDLLASSYEFLNGIMDYGDGYVGLGGDIYGVLELIGDDNITIGTTGYTATLKAASNANLEVGDTTYYRLNVNTSGIDYVRYDGSGYTLAHSLLSDGVKLRWSVSDFNYILTTTTTDVSCFIKLYNDPALETGLLLGRNSDNNNVVIYEDGTLSINYGAGPGTAAMTFDAAGLIGVANGDPAALIDIAGSTTSRGSLRVRSGTAPTTKPDGVIWYDGTDLYFQNDTTTKKFTLTT